MCICVYVYMCICVYVYMCICVYVYMCIHICIYIYIHGTPPETYLFDIFIRWLGQKGVTVPYIHAKGIIYIYILYIYILIV